MLITILLAALSMQPQGLFMAAWQTFWDGSCRFYAIEFRDDGPCRSAAYDIWCDPESPTCEALTAPPPDIPRCYNVPPGPREVE